MTGVILDAVVRKLISGTLQCDRLISNDGITTRNFTIDKLSGIFEGISIDADLSRKNIHCLGNTFGIAKNLDEYQVKICLNLSSLRDSDPIKFGLQEFRIAIIASFALLVMTLKSTDPANSLENWNFFATKLLHKTSKYVGKLGTDTAQPDDDLEETFDFFKVPLRDIQTAMKEVYAS